MGKGEEKAKHSLLRSNAAAPSCPIQVVASAPPLCAEEAAIVAIGRVFGFDAEEDGDEV